MGSAGAPCEDGFGLGRAPGFGADAAERDAGVSDAVVVSFMTMARRGEGELVGGAIAELEVEGFAAGDGRGSVTLVMSSPGWSAVSMCGVAPGSM